tara:strand:+ start:272 stop:532 length:261 start_codon:yes stop_codon:yes gene_type:complete
MESIGYEYRCVYIETAVSEGDFKDGVAGKKIASQVEIKLTELSEEGYDFYRTFNVPVDIKKGCFGNKELPDNLDLNMMVFRRVKSK